MSVVAMLCSLLEPKTEGHWQNADKACTAENLRVRTHHKAPRHLFGGSDTPATGDQATHKGGEGGLQVIATCRLEEEDVPAVDAGGAQQPAWPPPGP